MQERASHKIKFMWWQSCQFFAKKTKKQIYITNMGHWVNSWPWPLPLKLMQLDLSSEVGLQLYFVALSAVSICLFWLGKHWCQVDIWHIALLGYHDVIGCGMLTLRVSIWVRSPYVLNGDSSIAGLAGAIWSWTLLSVWRYSNCYEKVHLFTYNQFLEFFHTCNYTVNGIRTSTSNNDFWPP